MINEIVKYHNELNELSMRKWSAEEMDLFFTVLAKIKEKGTTKQFFNSDELKILTGTNTRNSYWFDMLEKFTTKAMNLIYKESDNGSFRKMAIFTYFEYKESDRTLEVEVSSRFDYIVNKLTANFTVYELAEFTSLKSTYSKTMYRILKQWKSLGEKEFKIEQFRELLDIPGSYNTSAINRQVINPIKKELPQYFNGLKVKAIKKNTQGTPVISYKFTWIPQKTKKNKKPKYINGKPTQFNDFKNSKTAKSDNLYQQDYRMSQAERDEFVEKKLKKKLPINKKKNERNWDYEKDLDFLKNNQTEMQ